METPIILYALIFVATLVLVEGLLVFARDWRTGREGRQINRRLRMLSHGEGGQEVLRKLTRTGGDMSFEGRLVRLPLIRGLDHTLHAAGVRTPTSRVLLLMAGAAALIYLIASQIMLVGATEAAVLSLAPVGLALLMLRFKASSRTNKFQTQLVEAIDMIVRSLRAGHPVASAIGLVAQEMPDPLGSEFGIVFDEMTYGLDLRDALENLTKRVGNPELHYLVVAVRIQFGTGGNLAEVLASLSKVLRDRAQMKSKIRAWSAEGRLTAIVLSLLPFAVAFLVHLANPNYYAAVQDDPLFPTMIGTGVGGIALGILVLRHMVNFKY